jgi:hypothetical protein
MREKEKILIRQRQTNREPDYIHTGMRTTTIGVGYWTFAVPVVFLFPARGVIGEFCGGEVVV